MPFLQTALILYTGHGFQYNLPSCVTNHVTSLFQEHLWSPGWTRQPDQEACCVSEGSRISHTEAQLSLFSKDGTTFPLIFQLILSSIIKTTMPKRSFEYSGSKICIETVPTCIYFKESSVHSLGDKLYHSNSFSYF